MLIARLIADPEGLETRLDRVVNALSEKGMSVAMARMLEHAGKVLHLSLPDGDIRTLRAVVEEIMQPQAALFSANDIEIPKLFVSDMDSTIIGQECIDELADFAGLKDQVSEITERAMLGELDFEAALRERVALLSGLEESAIDRCLAERIRPMTGARTLINTLKAHGCRTVLVTGGFHHFADAVGADLGFDRVVGNRLEVASGALTGGLVGPIADSSTKLNVLLEERAKISSPYVMAAGDGANDIPMLGEADYGIAYMAKPKARDAASGWVDTGNLSDILDLLDIPIGDRAG